MGVRDVKCQPRISCRDHQTIWSGLASNELEVTIIEKVRNRSSLLDFGPLVCTTIIVVDLDCAESVESSIHPSPQRLVCERSVLS